MMPSPGLIIAEFEGLHQVTVNNVLSLRIVLTTHRERNGIDDGVGWERCYARFERKKTNPR